MIDAIIFAEGVLGTTYGKTANGLCRFSKRYRIKAVVDSTRTGMDIQDVVRKASADIKIVKDLDTALNTFKDAKTLIIGVVTDGGYLPEDLRPVIQKAIKSGKNIVNGLHQFISDDPEFMRLARKYQVDLTDVRKMFMFRRDFFSGKIWEVKSFKLAVLGTDSAIGKRTTAVYLNEEMNRLGNASIMIGTGQTAWMQGFDYTVVIDAMVNDFVAGGIENTVVKAWNELKPDVMFLEGQGSVLHPAYPGSFEIIAASKPDAIILQHAPKRIYYDGFDGIKIPPLSKFIRILQELSDKKVIGISLNTENMERDDIPTEMERIEKEYGITCFDPMGNLEKIGNTILEAMKEQRE